MIKTPLPFNFQTTGPTKTEDLKQNTMNHKCSSYAAASSEIGRPSNTAIKSRSLWGNPMPYRNKNMHLAACGVFALVCECGLSDMGYRTGHPNSLEKTHQKPSIPWHLASAASHMAFHIWLIWLNLVIWQILRTERNEHKGGHRFCRRAQVVFIYEKKKPTWFILLSERIPAFSPPPAVSW